MIQSEPMLQPSWPFHSYFDSSLDQDGLNMGFLTSDEDHDFHSPITMEGFDDVSRWLCNDDQQMEEISTDSFEWSPSISMNSNDACAYILYETQVSMETESQTGIQNLLMAHAEAMELGQKELAKVIQTCVCQKASPVGPVIERLALNLFQCADNQEEYLKQETMRNFNTAFRAFYEIFPYSRFAHFTANSAILEAIPTDVDYVHIVDFDICEGSQWPPVIEAIARLKKSLIITSIKLHQYQDSQFEHTKRNLCNFAKSFGLNLKVREMDMAQMVKGIEGREFLAFNCMIGLPHMGRTRETNQVTDFLKIAKGVLAKNKGIITIGDGEDHDIINNSSSYTSFFDRNMTHYKALYESMECGFPSYLTEGRIAMETLFIAPFIKSKSWFQKWEEGREKTVFPKNLELQGRKMCEESWNEAREMVKEGETPYGIKIEGENGNELVLEWRGTPLVRVSAWM